MPFEHKNEKKNQHKPAVPDTVAILGAKMDSVLSWSCLCLVSVMSRSCLCLFLVMPRCCFGVVLLAFWWYLVVFWGSFSDVLVTSRACFGEVSVMFGDGAVMF